MGNKGFSGVIAQVTGKPKPNGGTSTGTSSNKDSFSTSKGGLFGKLHAYLKKKQEAAKPPRKPMSQMGDTQYTPVSDENYNSSTPTEQSVGRGKFRQRSREVKKWGL